MSDLLAFSDFKVRPKYVQVVTGQSLIVSIPLSGAYYYFENIK